MHRKTIVAALALAAVAAIPARADTWDFSYTGATSVDAPFGLPLIEGRFSGEDRDGDGVLRADELQSLSFFHYAILPATDMGLPGAPEAALSSQLTHFEFSLAAQTLAFDAKAGGWHDAYEKAGDQLHYTTGIGLFTFELGAAAFAIRSAGVSLPLAATQPVPEPATWGLMFAGLLAVGAWAQRRRAAADSAQAWV